MNISIHQPDYIPYLGYFYKISQSDVFVYLDDAQFSNDNMHHWNRIKTPQGECRLKVPVEQHFGNLINGIRTRDELKWKEKHLKSLEMSYSKAPYYHELYPRFRELLEQGYTNLADMNIAINNWIVERFGFQVKVYRSSDMKIHTLREERVLDICQMLGCNTYISGNGARAYQIGEHFKQRGIELVYSDYKPIEYPQRWIKCDFLPYMSVLDYVFNCGFDWQGVRDKLKENVNGNR